MITSETMDPGRYSELLRTLHTEVAYKHVLCTNLLWIVTVCFPTHVSMEAHLTKFALLLHL